LADEPCQLITADLAWLRPIISSTRFEAAECIETPRNLARAIAECAETDLQRGAAGDPSALDANYVRRSDAELYWTDN
jgi:hypothetical protein